MPHLLLVNPNTSAATTLAMLAIAQEAAPLGVNVIGATVADGVGLITNEVQLAAAHAAMLALMQGLSQPPDGLIIAAFGDPGLAAARAMLPCPVTGIAEAGMAEAASGRRPFAVATTTPGLADSIARLAESYGHDALFRGVHLTPGEPATLMKDRAALETALAEACRAARQAGAEAVVIGGGPLAQAARAIAPRLDLSVIEPVPAAVRLAAARAAGRVDPAGF